MSLSRLRSLFRRRRAVRPPDGADAPRVPDVPAADAQRIDAVRREIRCILRESEFSALALGQSLSDICRSAEGYVEHIQSSVGTLGSTDESGVSGTLSHQCRTVDTFLRELAESVGSQKEASLEIVKTARVVSDLALTVGKISSAARILCLNTMIEASRLGEHGKPFLVIGNQMRELSEKIGSSNRQISALANELLPLIENANDHTAAIEAQAASFAGDFEAQRQGIGGLVDRLHATAHDALSLGDDRLAEILRSSNDSLVNLQSQDIITQRLNRILSILGDELESVAGHPPIGVQVIGGAVAPAFDRTSAALPASPAEPISTSRPYEEGDLMAGEMELF